MIQPPPTTATRPAALERRIGLRSAVLFNMLEMIGVGPFITLPLVIAAAGFRLSVWAWVLGAAIAVADGLVWAELGAAFPRAGGSYAFLREIYGPDRAGNWLSFLYVWQLSFTAPLSIASGCIGLSGFLAVFWPGLESTPIAALPAIHYASFAAAAACLLVTALLYRNLSSITRLAWVLFAGVMAALTGVIVSGFAHAAATGGWHMPSAPALPVTLALSGLSAATLIATYDYWGYYNITFLGSEVRNPERTIPRAILLSVLFVSAFYIAMNLAALPSLRSATAHAAESAALRVQLVSDIARSAFGQWAGYTIAALIIWTAFSSVFSLQLGYSRVPYAAARDGNYFRFLAAVHPRHGIPHRSLVALGLVGAFFCFFTLTQVITMLVITRILLQFFLQQIGVILLRIQRPNLPRPFRIPLYPLPPLAAMAGFAFILVNRAHALIELAVAAGIATTGTLIYLFRAHRLRQWPFAPKPESLAP
ncbi:Amino acid transporter, amino acid-polyamine-organocation (APC) family [Candidatus Sulfotelmatomonas gaucii]|uniref:Amino acid transporter, amino acid-polyamine-organocation (APC) family n=1 Tax=Candidatus Sulfuritelmatomonas gaucii TaxID=2043161 RepID=A0A2N9L4F0_9BACT|nr:Amino acid transporter, amino acid-polyamine-organocation (APC) family [Candidatus Sulfotelmatomonas gaucii]